MIKINYLFLKWAKYGQAFFKKGFDNMLVIKTNKGIFDGYVNLYKYMSENNLNEIEIISVNFYSEHLEFLRDNASVLYKSLFQYLRKYSFDEIEKIVS